MIVWNDIKFINVKNVAFEKDILTARLITVPAAPAFVENEYNTFYWDALRYADFSIFDSSLFVILSSLKGLKIHKYSGYQLVKDTIAYLKLNDISLFFVNPNETSDYKNRNYITENTIVSSEKISSYVSPYYQKNVLIEDFELLRKLNIVKPRLILINIAGGKQEILGAFLKKFIEFETTILCTGAAISFFTGEQAAIPNWIDKLYLGWLARVIDNPKTYLPRYLNAFRFVPLFYKHKLNKRS